MRRLPAPAADRPGGICAELAPGTLRPPKSKSVLLSATVLIRFVDPVCNMRLLLRLEPLYISGKAITCCAPCHSTQQYACPRSWLQTKKQSVKGSNLVMWINRCEPSCFGKEVSVPRVKFPPSTPTRFERYLVVLRTTHTLFLPTRPVILFALAIFSFRPFIYLPLIAPLLC